MVALEFFQALLSASPHPVAEAVIDAGESWVQRVCELAGASPERLAPEAPPMNTGKAAVTSKQPIGKRHRPLPGQALNARAHGGPLKRHKGAETSSISRSAAPMGKRACKRRRLFGAPPKKKGVLVQNDRPFSCPRGTSKQRDPQHLMTQAFCN